MIRQHRWMKHIRTHAVLSGVILTGALMSGCGTITIRHTPEPRSISADKIPDLRGSQSLNVTNGQGASEEIEIGTVGWGRLVGNLQGWTGAVVSFLKKELSQRGATLTESAPKTLTLSVTKAELRTIPIVGGATSTVSLSVTTAEGVRKEFQGSASNLHPPSAVNGAATDAVERMLGDETIGAYLRR